MQSTYDTRSDEIRREIHFRLLCQNESSWHLHVCVLVKRVTICVIHVNLVSNRASRCSKINSNKIHVLTIQSYIRLNSR